jgi:hypothetical protein
LQAVEGDAAPQGDVRAAALRALLHETHAVFALLHGSLRDLLDADASAATARHDSAPAAPCLSHTPQTVTHRRRLLQPLVADLGARLCAGKGGELAALGNALAAREGLPILPLERATFLQVQFVVNALATCCGGTLVQQVLVLHDANLVWSGAC